MCGHQGDQFMTRQLITHSALAAPLALTVDCSSVRNDPAPNYGTVGGPVLQDSSQYEQYGTVRNIQQLDTTRRSSGAGAILGAVVGGVVGNQIGSGTGRAAATAAGAVGGAVVGNKLEKGNGAVSSYYQVVDSLDDGGFTSFDSSDR